MLSSAMSVEHGGKHVLALQCPEQNIFANVMGPSRPSRQHVKKTRTVRSTLEHVQEGHDCDTPLWKGLGRKAATP